MLVTTLVGPHMAHVQEEAMLAKAEGKTYQKSKQEKGISSMAPHPTITHILAKKKELQPAKWTTMWTQVALDQISYCYITQERCVTYLLSSRICPTRKQFPYVQEPLPTMTTIHNRT